MNVPAAKRRAFVVAAAVATVALAGGCTDDDRSSGSFCDELREAPSLAAVLTGFADQDPSRLEQQLDLAREEYGDLRDAAPSDISPDVDRTVDLVDAVIEAVRADSTDPEKAAAAVREVVGDHRQAATSGLAVADYAREQCDVELDPAGASDEGGETPADGTGEEPPDADPETPTTGEDGSVQGGM